jgi:hypothetical protein
VNFGGLKFDLISKDFIMKYEVEVTEYGTKFWYLNGELHREDGPAIECANGTKRWYQNDKRHREDGPAVEYADGSKIWYLNSKRHREDGPACEYANGVKYWYLNSEYLSEEEFNKRTKVIEMTVEEVEKLLGHRVKIVSDKD